MTAKKSALDIVRCLDDPRIFGALLPWKDKQATAVWRAVLKAIYGLPMSRDEEATVKRLSGRQRLPEKPVREALLLCGRRSGKSTVSALLAAFEAVTAKSGHVVLTAQDRLASQRVVFKMLTDIFEGAPALKREVVRQTSDTLELKSGVMVSVYPARPASVRGLAIPCWVGDEIAYMTSSEDGIAVDRDMVRAIRPALATFPDAKLLMLTSPASATGVAYETWKRHYGNDDSDETLVIAGTSLDFNGTLDRRALDAMREEDPEGYKSEIEAEFRTDVRALLDAVVIENCTDDGRIENAPLPRKCEYVCAVDPSGGRQDSYAAAILHREPDGHVIVDALRIVKPPFDPKSVTEDLAHFARRYYVHRVCGDRYAGEWPRGAWRAEGFTYDVAETTASENFLTLMAEMNSGRVSLCDNVTLLKELRGLVRKPRQQKDVVSHGPSGHDDAAAAVALGVSLLTTHRRNKFAFASA